MGAATGPSRSNRPSTSPLTTRPSPGTTGSASAGLLLDHREDLAYGVPGHRLSRFEKGVTDVLSPAFLVLHVAPDHLGHPESRSCCGGPWCGCRFGAADENGEPKDRCAGLPSGARP